MKTKQKREKLPSPSSALEIIQYKIFPRHVSVKGKRIVTVVPVSHLYRFEPGRIQPQKYYVLSRFAFCRRKDQDLILESPLSYAYLILHDPRVISLLFLLIQPQRSLDIPKQIPGISKNKAQDLFVAFYSAGALSAVNKEKQIEEDHDVSLQQWEFHDLLFHSRSRLGRHSNPYGKTNRFVGKVEPPPLVKTKTSQVRIDLFKPDIRELRQNDIPFTRVLEDRRSKREHSKTFISKRELGEFLFRSARIRKTFHVNGFDFTDRIYPASGAAYELELYLAINQCNGIRSGLYQYCPFDHQLIRISKKTFEVQKLLRSAAHTAHTNIPQILIILSARFQRMSWRYESISYSAILKDVGVLYQTFYLVATAMGLSPCALGVGDSDLFVKAAKTNYYEETSVGEFIIGR